MPQSIEVAKISKRINMDLLYPSISNFWSFTKNAKAIKVPHPTELLTKICPDKSIFWFLRVAKFLEFVTEGGASFPRFFFGGGGLRFATKFLLLLLAF